MNIDWSMPWLLLIALQPLMLFMLRAYLDNKCISNYTSKKLQPWVAVKNKNNMTNSKLLRNISYSLAWILFAIAAAGPRIAEQQPENVSSAGKDIFIVLDISQSMHATDIEPSRLRQAHQKINYMVNAINNSRIGIIVYAAKPHLYVPLTYDKNALDFYLRNIDLLVPPSQGSKPLAALKYANKLLSNEKNNAQRSQTIVLITDADTTNSMEDAITGLIKKNIPVYTYLISSQHGEAVPDFNEGWINKDGRPIISRPNPKEYGRLSNSTNGILVTVSTDNSGVNSIIDNIESLSGQSSFDNNYSNWQELFYIFLLPAIFFLFISMSPYKFKIVRKAAISPLFLVAFSFIMSATNTDLQANQDKVLREAHQALIKQDYTRSRALYASIDSYRARYGEAVSSYRLTDYPRAIRLFEQTILLAESNIDFSNALYNLGNSYFQVGNYKHAITSYEDALLYDSSNKKITLNMIFAKKALQAVEERNKLLALTTRSGRGPRTARAADNIEINDGSSVSIDNSNLDKIDDLTTATLPEINIPEFVILKGLEFAKTSSNNSNINAGNKYDLTTTTNAYQVNSIFDNQSLLWKRIFELEEGYPAPLTEPEVILGIEPW